MKAAKARTGVLIPERDGPTGDGEHYRVGKGGRPTVGVAIARPFQAQTRRPAGRCGARHDARHAGAARSASSRSGTSPAPDLDGSGPGRLRTWTAAPPRRYTEPLNVRVVLNRSI
jgi:hypothetical protein